MSAIEILEEVEPLKFDLLYLYIIISDINFINTVYDEEKASLKD